MDGSGSIDRIIPGAPSERVVTTAPFLKWAGGKRWLAPLIAFIVQRNWVYHEPFLGSGACFFRVGPANSHLSDVNCDLIAAFQAVQRSPKSVSRVLADFEISRQRFNQVKLWTPRTNAEVAAKLIYLNRTAFAGLYRVNKYGVFNVPFGCKAETKLPDESALREWSARLSGATVACLDFEASLQRVKRWHFAYIDPPYTVKHTNGTFRRYNETIFSWKDQERLAHASVACAERGARVLISNANSSDVRRLYPSRLFDVIELVRLSNLAANPKFRGQCTELLFASRNLGLRGSALRGIRLHFEALVSPRVSVRH